MIKCDKKFVRKGLTKTICGVPMPILQRLAQPFNGLDDLTVYSEIFEPFLERSLRWQIKPRERFDPNYHGGSMASQFNDNYMETDDECACED